MKSKILATSLFFLIVLLFLNVSPVLACQPPPPDWWFTETIEVSPDKYPDILLISKSDGDKGLVEDRASVRLQNISGNEMYVLGNINHPYETFEQPDGKIPEGYVAYKMLSRGVVTKFSGFELPNIAPGFIDQNTNIGDRPMNVEIPASQSGEILVLMGDQIFQISVTVIYVLKSDYDPDVGKDACGNIFIQMPLFLAISGFNLVINKAPILCASFLVLLTIVYIWKLKIKEA